MQIKMKFDTRGFNKLEKDVKKNMPKAIKTVIDGVAFDLMTNYRNKTASGTDIVRDGNKLRPYTKSASRYKRAKLKNLVSQVYLNNKPSGKGMSQYEYLKNSIDKGMVRTRTPKKQYLLVPSKTYNRRKKYGQADKHGGIDIRAKDFWLPNRHGNKTLFERKGGKLNPLWHTVRGYRYSKPTVSFYGDAFAYFNKKKNYYSGKFFRTQLQKRLKKKY